MKVHRVNVAAALLAACIFGSLPAPSLAGPNTVLKVHIGWGDRVRPGHWTPIFIQATDPTPQAALIEINAPQGGLYSMQIQQYFTIGPVASVLTLYVPLQSGWGDGPAVVIRDEHGKTMARYPPDPENDNFYQRAVNGNARFVGISGVHTSLENMLGQLPGNQWEPGYLDPDVLPATPLGYDSLDLLVLNEPDLLHMGGEQQQAIVDWVRGGGSLILWPGDDPAPRSGPLVDALPCTIAGRSTIRLTDRDLARLGLPPRFAGIRGRALVPRPGAEAVDLFGIGLIGAGPPGPGAAYRQSVGLGAILVVPVNLSQLQFEVPANQFWATLTAGAAVARTPNDQNASYDNVDAYTRRQYIASQSLEDFLGNVPGAGKFGFSYVAMVLLGMMVVVGPVDWFVLRKLGRQPWTWVTTTGWIVLVTGGALFIGHVFKSGKLHYRSVRVIDQAGGATVGETSLTGIYSPRTTGYHLDAVPADLRAANGADASHPAPPPGWWSIASTNEYGSRGGIASDVEFHQTDQGNAPEEMFINVWNLRFLREETTRAGPAMIDATLERSSRNGKPHLSGVIRNLTGKPLTNVRVRVKAGVAPPIGRIEPNGSVNVDAYLDTFPSQVPASQYFPNTYGYAPAVMGAGDVWAVAGDLSGLRTHRIETILKTDDFACIYADCPGSEPPANLREAADGIAVQQHYELIRALVPLASGDFFRHEAGD